LYFVAGNWVGHCLVTKQHNAISSDKTFAYASGSISVLVFWLQLRLDKRFQSWFM